MSNITITRGEPVRIEATIPAGKRGQVRAAIYSPKNKRLSVTAGVVTTPNGDGSTAVVLTFTPPGLWFRGDVCTPFIDCALCGGYGTGKYVIELIEFQNYPVANLFLSELSSGSISVSAPEPSKSLLDELCPDCADSAPTPGDDYDSTVSPSDPLTPNPSAPAGDACLPPDFVNPTPTVPTPCSP